MLQQGQLQQLHRNQQQPSKRQLPASEKPQEQVWGTSSTDGPSFCLMVDTIVSVDRLKCWHSCHESMSAGCQCAGQPHRSLVFASQGGRAETLPGPGTSGAAELAMSRPDIAPTSLSPALNALSAAKPAPAMEQPLPEQPASVRIEQVGPCLDHCMHAAL